MNITALLASLADVSPADVSATDAAALVTVPERVQTLCALGELIGLLAAAVLVFVGLRRSVRDISFIDKEDPDNEQRRMTAAMYSGMKTIGLALLAYFFSRFCCNYPPMRSEDYGWLGISLQSFWETIYRTGFLLLIPYIIRQWRITARRNAYKN